MKEFFKKIWSKIKALADKGVAWAKDNKLIATVMAITVVFGIACAIVIPITLHTHTFDTEWSSNAQSHWHNATCKHNKKQNVAAHSFNNACDADCNVCGYTRTPSEHVYDNTCDSKCNICGETRDVDTHVYDHACDLTCNICGAERTSGAHSFDNNCDTVCNICGATRAANHAYSESYTIVEDVHYYECLVCGVKKDEEAHSYTLEVISAENLKEAATTTTKAQYWKTCACGKKSEDEYFEEDKKVATVRDITELSRSYDGTPIADPDFFTNSDGKALAVIEWYLDGVKLDSKPVNAGIYTVKITIPETVAFTSVEAEAEFLIYKANSFIGGVFVETKFYDGEPVDDPTYDATFPVDLIEYKLYNADNSTYTTEKPTEIGEYMVRITIFETDNYDGYSTTKEFAIRQPEE